MKPVIEKQSVKLDWTRLLGFDQVAAEDSALSSAKVGSKSGQKTVKLGIKLGVKLGVKSSKV